MGLNKEVGYDPRRGAPHKVWCLNLLSNLNISLILSKTLKYCIVEI